VKLLRLFGDNGKLNDNMLIARALDLFRTTQRGNRLGQARRIGPRQAEGSIIDAYEYDAWPIEPAIAAFEAQASRQVKLSVRPVAAIGELVHPVHQSGAVFAWEIEPA